MTHNLDTDTENILRLLCYVILADGHIFDEEIEALSQCVTDIGLKDQHGTILNQEIVTEWFHANKVELMHKNAQGDRDIALTRLILKLADWPAKEKILEALARISASDGIVHHEEKLFAHIVKAYWQHTDP